MEIDKYFERPIETIPPQYIEFFHPFHLYNFCHIFFFSSLFVFGRAKSPTAIVRSGK